MKLLIIDSNSLLHRAFHALPPLENKNGDQTGAVYGFLLIFFKAIKDVSPNFIAATFDLPFPTFRHKEFKEYKAKRPKTPEELSMQISLIKEILSDFSISIFEKKGFEADDLIATISHKVLNKKDLHNLEIFILTGDSDAFQLIDDRVKVYTLGKGVKEVAIYDEKKVVEKFELFPKQLVDFKALAGDPSDNVPGVPGVGKKTATYLIRNFESLNGLYNAIEKDDSKIKNIKERIKNILIQNKEQAFFSKVLVKTKEDVPINFDIGKCKFNNFQGDKIKDVLRKFEFFSLVKRLERKEKEEDYYKKHREKKLF